MGSVWKGSGLALDKNARAMDANPDPKIFDQKELAAINIAKKVRVRLGERAGGAGLGGAGLALRVLDFPTEAG